MRRNILFLVIVIIAIGFLSYFGSRPDLVAIKTDDGNGIRLRGPAAESDPVYMRISSNDGFRGTWVYSIASADFPSSHIRTHRLVLNQDGTASLVEESRDRVNSEAEAEYRTVTKTRSGTWSEHGHEARIYLD